MFFELRQYRILPGKRDAWVRFMEEDIIPGQLAHGTVIVGSFVGQDEDDLYVWIRRFENEEQCTAFNASYYASEEWENQLLPRVKEMLASHIVTRLHATPKSVIQ